MIFLKFVIKFIIVIVIINMMMIDIINIAIVVVTA